MKGLDFLPGVTQAFNYMAVDRQSPVTIDAQHNFWSATQSSFMTRRAIHTPESESIPLRNWIFLLIPSPIPELELALPSPGGIGIELELPSFELELESELHSSELNSELPSWN